MANFAMGFALGVLAGATVGWIVFRLRRRATDTAIGDAMRETFAALASEALDTNSRRLAESAGATLESKKALIDQSLAAMNERLEQVRQYVQATDAARRQEFGSLNQSVSSLATTTGELHKMLASTQRRGAWGERMAEDVLRLAGLQEGVNYTKQSAADAETGKPDFTFLLPNGLKANMDVKFPLERYKSYLDAKTEPQRQQELMQLVASVRGHVRAVAGRGYIDPKVPTVEYVIVFIPSEAIYGLVLEADGDLIDEALKKKIVLAGPLTLYAMLAIIRQAAERANVAKTADEVASLLSQFYKEWQKYNEAMDLLGQRIESVAKQYDTVRGARSNMLQKPLDRIEQLRTTRGLIDQDGPPPVT